MDTRVAEDAPVYKSLRPATRLSRAVALYSFGAKSGEDRGVVRSDLLAAVQQPGLTADVLDVCLQQLIETLLYIHSTGRRYRFEKKPNLNKLIDDAARKFEPDEVQAEVRRSLEKQIGVREGFLIWPRGHEAVPDRKPRFHVVFLGPEHALGTRTELERIVLEWTENRGENKRQYRNALVFALPASVPMDEARAAARMRLAITQLIDDAKRLNLGPDDLDDLKGRLNAVATAAETAVRRMYPTLLLPVASPESAALPMRLEPFEIQEHQAAGVGLLENIHRQLANWVFDDRIQPRKLIDCLHLGDGDVGQKGHWVRGPDVVDLFFGSIQFPKLMNLDTLRATIASGVQKGLFGYVMGATEKGDTLTPRSADSLTYAEKDLEPGDIDLSAGSYLVSAELAKRYLADFGKPEPVVTPIRLPESSRSSSLPPPPFTPGQAGGIERPSVPPEPGRREVILEFETNAEGLFKSFRVLQLLSDWSDAGFAASVRINAKATKDLDPHWYETAIVDALGEEGVGVKR